jgi:hypothetical protein
MLHVPLVWARSRCAQNYETKKEMCTSHFLWPTPAQPDEETDRLKYGPNNCPQVGLQMLDESSMRPEPSISIICSLSRIDASKPVSAGVFVVILEGERV